MSWGGFDLSKRPRIPPEVQKLFDAARVMERAAPRKHHLVPAFYLRRWAENAQLRVTDVNAGHDYKTSPQKAARQTDFYRLESEDLNANDLPPLLFELLLGHIEEWGKAAIEKLVTAPAELEPKVVADFAWYLAMQFTRGAAFRAELRAMTTAYFKLRYGKLTDAGVRSELRRRGLPATDDLVARSKRFFDELEEGSAQVAPQDAAAVGWAGKAARDIGEHFLTRTWVVFETPATMLTSDEPLVLVGGPGLPRDERPGIATAGVVLLPLDPTHLLALFRDDVAERLAGVAPPTSVALGQLDQVETTEVCREVAMNAHRWTFERPSKRLGAQFKIPPSPESFSIQDVGPQVKEGTETRQLVRTFKKNRWAALGPSAPWPVAGWWH